MKDALKKLLIENGMPETAAEAEALTTTGEE